tara:strand:- start:611 stop:793 length:183 start_codon:yes stop_codon:yes gene_type:complete
MKRKKGVWLVLEIGGVYWTKSCRSGTEFSLNIFMPFGGFWGIWKVEIGLILFDKALSRLA